MEQEAEQNPKPRTVNKSGRGRSLLTSAILLGASFLGRSDANANEPQNPETGNVPEYSHRIVIPGISSDETKEIATQLPFETVMQGINSKLTIKEDRVFSNSEELKEYWELFGEGQPPTLNQGEVIVLTAQGPKDTLTATKIDRIEKLGGHAQIFVKDYFSPKEQQTSPFDAEKLNADGMQLSFIHETINGDFYFAITSSARTDGSGDEVIGPTIVDITPKSP